MQDKGPPLILDCAVVLAYALHGEAARYTGRGATYHAGRLVGPDIKRSAISRNLGAPYDYLFFYCGDDWSVEAAVGHDTLEEARAYAARMYAGIEDVMVQVSPSQADIETALDAYWEGKRCSRCYEGGPTMPCSRCINRSCAFSMERWSATRRSPA